MTIWNSWFKWPSLFILGFLLLNIYAGYEKIDLHDGQPLGYGAYGLLVANYPENLEGKNVLFLGNSVHAGYKIVEGIQKRFTRAKLPVKFGNFSHGGASIADYIAHYRHVRQFKPDLLVVALNPSSLGQDWPYFRNDSHKALLHPNYISLLKEKSFRKLYSRDMYVESFWYSYFPIFRWVEVFGIKHKRNIGIFLRDSKLSSLRLMSFFAIRPSLAFDTKMRRDKGKKTNEVVPTLAENEYKNAEDLVNILIREIERDQQKTLFLIQPNSMPKGPVIQKIGELIKDKPNFYFEDHSMHWNKSKYSDDVHPNIKGADEDTFRQFELINKILNDK